MNAIFTRRLLTALGRQASPDNKRVERFDLFAGGAKFRARLELSITEALHIALKNGELSEAAPVRELSLIFVAIINSSDATTRDTNSFAKVEELYSAFLTIVEQSGGAKSAT